MLKIKKGEVKSMLMIIDDRNMYDQMTEEDKIKIIQNMGIGKSNLQDEKEIIYRALSVYLEKLKD